MKKQILLWSTLTILAVTANSQTVWRVNNNPAADADVATLQAAHDIATAGDIIYLEPSGNSYDTCTFTKQLIVIGPGYFLAENDTIAFHNDAKTGVIKFNTGSEGTIIMGVFINGEVIINADNIALKRNRIDGIGDPLIDNFANNTIIMQNYISNNYNTGASNTLNSTGLNLLLANNYIYKLDNSSYNHGISVSSGSAEVKNNIILCEYNNSIINTLFYNNIYNGNISDNGSNSIEFNLNYTDLVFVGGNSPDGRYQLKAGSAAIGAGKDGEDCGIFGGAEPYVISGIPPIPSIIDVNMPTSGSQQGGLPVTIKIQSNN